MGVTCFEQHVRGLEVAVDDLLGMEVLHGAGLEGFAAGFFIRVGV
jgi:hypothetical protein